MNKSVFGLDENIAALVAYVGTFVTGIIVLVMEKENKFVRFAALQSTVFFLGILVLNIAVNILVSILGAIPFLGWIIGGLLGWLLPTAIGLLSFGAWIYLMYTAYKGQKFKLPIVGDIVEQQIEK